MVNEKSNKKSTLSNFNKIVNRVLYLKYNHPFHNRKNDNIEYSMINETSNKKSTLPNFIKIVKRVLFWY